MNTHLSDDSKAILLLCAVFSSDSNIKPLTLIEYTLVVKWLIKYELRPKDMLDKENIIAVSKGTGLSLERLKSLLARGVQLGFTVEEWQRKGIWIICRSDKDYPSRILNHLKEKSPPILYGVGNKSLLEGGGLAVVGSRNIDSIGEEFTKKVAKRCASNLMPIVSGGARGVDQISMKTILDTRGLAIGVLSDNLIRNSLDKKYRKAISEGVLLLISPYHPNARFTVGTAMGRNKLIYSMADYALIVSSDFNKGGTWAGAQEELKRENSIPVFVRIDNNVPKGNKELLTLGAKPWPKDINTKLSQQLSDLSEITIKKTKELEQGTFGFMKPNGQTFTYENIPTKKQNESSKLNKERKKGQEIEIVEKETFDEIYNAVLPVIIRHIENPMSVDELVKKLNITKGQLNSWLKKAVQDKKIQKLRNPIRYKKV